MRPLAISKNSKLMKENTVMSPSLIRSRALSTPEIILADNRSPVSHFLAFFCKININCGDGSVSYVFKGLLRLFLCTEKANSKIISIRTV